MEKGNGFYDIVKNCKGGLTLKLPAFDASLNDRTVSLPFGVEKVRVPRVYALGVFVNNTLTKMYEQGYFSVEPAAEFKKDVADIFTPVLNVVEIVDDKTILEYLTRGNRVAIKKLIEENGVNRDNVLTIARANVNSLSTSMVKDLEKILGIELLVEGEDEQ